MTSVSIRQVFAGTAIVTWSVLTVIRVVLTSETTTYSSNSMYIGAVLCHCRDQTHVISKNNVEALAREEGWFKRKVRKAIEIKTLQLTINRDQGFDLPAIYSELLPFPRDRDHQTNDHLPMSSGQLA